MSRFHGSAQILFIIQDCVCSVRVFVVFCFLGVFCGCGLDEGVLGLMENSLWNAEAGGVMPPTERRRTFHMNVHRQHVSPVGLH